MFEYLNIFFVHMMSCVRDFQMIFQKSQKIIF